MSPSTVVGSAEVIIRANSTGFASEIRAETSPAFAGLASDAEVAGSDAGLALRGGVKDGTKDIEKDLEETGEAGGGKFSKGIAGAFSSLGNVASNFMPGIGKTMSETGEKAAGMGEKVESAGGILGKIPVPAAIAAGAIIAIGGEAVKMGMAMQTADAAIAVSSGTSVKAATAIGDAFLSTAGKSEFSGQEMATVYATVAGQLKNTEGHALSRAEAMTVMTAADDLATAKQIDLGSATTALAGIMQAFQLPAKDAAGATDVLFNASNATGQSIPALAGGLEKLRSKLGDTSPPLGALASLMVDMTSKGITGRAAIAGVNTAMTGLVAAATGSTKAGKTSEAALLSYGVSAKTASGQLTPMSTIIDKLGPKFTTMTQTQQLAAATTIFGASAAKAMVAVIDGGPAAYDKASKSVNAMGAAHAAAGVQGQTLGVMIKTLKATVEDWMTQLGEKLIPIVTKVADWLGKMLPGFIHILGLAWDGLRVILNPVIDILKVVFKFLEEHKPILYALAIAVGMVVAPLLLVAVALGELQKHWKAIWADITKVFGEAIKWVEVHIKDFLAVLLVVFTGGLALIPLLIVRYWHQIETFTMQLVHDVVGFFTALPGEIVAGLGDIVGTIWAGLSGAGKWVEDNVITPVIGFFTGLPAKIVTGLGDIVKTIWHGLLNAAGWITTNVITPVVGFFAGLPSKVVTALGSITTTIWRGLVGAAMWVWNNVELPVLGFFAGLPGKIVGALGNILGTIWHGLTGAAAWVGTNVITPVVNFFTSLPGKIVKALGSGLSLLAGWGMDIVTGIGNAITSGASIIWNALKSAVMGAITSLKGAVSHIPLIGGALNAIGLAAGGLVTQPTFALVGEAGPEVVVPLAQLSSGFSAGIKALPGVSHAPAASGGGSGGFRDLYITAVGSNLTPAQWMQEISWGLKTGSFETKAVA